MSESGLFFFVSVSLVVCGLPRMFLWSLVSVGWGHDECNFFDVHATYMSFLFTHTFGMALRTRISVFLVCSVLEVN